MRGRTSGRRRLRCGRKPTSQTPRIPSPRRPQGVAGGLPGGSERERGKWDSPAGQGCLKCSRKVPKGSFRGTKTQPCFFPFRERSMSYARHAEAGPQDPPDAVGAVFGRQGRDVPHRRSRKGAGEQIASVSNRKSGRSDGCFPCWRLFTSGGGTPGQSGRFGQSYAGRNLRFAAKIMDNSGMCYPMSIVAACCARLLRYLRERAGVPIAAGRTACDGRERPRAGFRKTVAILPSDRPLISVLFRSCPRRQETFGRVVSCGRNLKLFAYACIMYGRARMKNAHGAAEDLGRPIAANRRAVRPPAARPLTGRGGGLPAIADFQAHAAKLPRQAAAALFQCRGQVLLPGNRCRRISATAQNRKGDVIWHRTI